MMQRAVCREKMGEGEKKTTGLQKLCFVHARTTYTTIYGGSGSRGVPQSGPESESERLDAGFVTAQAAHALVVAVAVRRTRRPIHLIHLHPPMVLHQPLLVLRRVEELLQPTICCKLSAHLVFLL